MPDPVVPGPPASVLAAVSGGDTGGTPSNPAFTGRATFNNAGGAYPFLPSLMTDVVQMPASAYLDADVQIAGNLVVDGSFGFTQNNLGTFGDGSDGAVVLDGVTSFPNFATLSASQYTLTRDVFSTGVTVNGGVTLLPNGNRVFCQGAFSNFGTVSAAGGAGGATGTAGAAVGSTTVGNGGSGGGGQTTTGSAGGTKNAAAGTGLGGGGGTGTGGNTGGAGGSIGNSSVSQLRIPAAALSGAVYVSGSTGPIGGGSGGGGGGGDGSNKGGGGGAGGGVVLIFAQSADNHAGTISAPGGAGGTPTAGNTGGGGGGGGGLILVYTLSAWSAGTTNVAGGAAGSLHGTGTNGTAGTAGSVLNVVLQ